MDPTLRAFKDALLARRVAVAHRAKVAAKAPWAKDYAEAEKASKKAARLQKRVLDMLWSRRVNSTDVDKGLVELREGYLQATQIAESFVKTVEEFLSTHKDAPKYNSAVHDLTILKDTFKRFRDMGVEKAESFHDLYESEGLGSGPMRKSQYHRIVERARALGNAPQGYFNTMDSVVTHSLSTMTTERTAATKPPTADELEEWWDHMTPGQQRSVAQKNRVPANPKDWNAKHWDSVMDHYVQIEMGDSRGYNRGRNV